MPGLIKWIATRWSALRDRLRLRHRITGTYFGPLLIDRGHGLLYDVERDLTWLQDTNYARTVNRSPDGQLTWDDAKAWVAGLEYRGFKRWRLPTGLNQDGSGPCLGDNCRESELGHLVFIAFQRKSPGLQLLNWQTFSIYWSSTEVSATEAIAFKMTGLKQGRLAKDPWAVDPALGGAVPLTDLVLTWPVHDGDVGAGFLVRVIDALFTLLRRR